MSKLRVLDLFSGIGGFSLGLERTGGFETVAFCEIEPFCQRVLKKHWPDVPIYDDVTKLKGSDVGAVDVICGGFPCQDISHAGLGKGLDGSRSGLWREYARIIGELGPKYVIVENVAALLYRGLDRVLGDLATLGYHAEWHCIPASAVGAPHRRDRVWIVAYASGKRCMGIGSGSIGNIREAQSRTGDGSTPLADASCEYSDGIPYFTGSSQLAKAVSELGDGCGTRGEGYWAFEPDVGRMADGVPSRVDRLRSLGNAVVPQIPELIGRAILATS